MTIKDLARLAGVAHSTVSRSLNDSPLVSEETRNRIKSLAREHGYSPNSFARKLVTRRSHTLGLFFLSLDELKFMENFGTQFIPGITAACNRAGYDLLLFTTPKNRDNTRSYLELCREKHVEGVIFIGLTSDDPHLAEIRNSTIPASIIDFHLPGPNITHIGSDNTRGINLAMDWLHGQGHQSIAFIGGPENSPVAMEREAVYKAHLELRGTLDPALLFRGNFSRESGYWRALDLLKKQALPTAVLAANDLMALGAMKAFKEHGLRVPVDISVMGYDNALASEYTDPGLTTIGQDTEAIGTAAVDCIMKRLEGLPVTDSIRIEPSLVLRESVRRIAH